MINTRGDHIRFLFSQFRQEETVILQLYFLPTSGTKILLFALDFDWMMNFHVCLHR
jgi:hypothetical protein